MARTDFSITYLGNPSPLPQDVRTAGALAAQPGTHHLRITNTSAGIIHALFERNGISQSDAGVKGFIGTDGGSANPLPIFFLRKTAAATFYKFVFGAFGVTTPIVRLFRVSGGIETLVASVTTVSFFNVFRNARVMVRGADFQVDADTGSGLVSIMSGTDPSPLVGAGGVGFGMWASGSGGLLAPGYDNLEFINVV